jgi:anti-sigma factor RsiW
MNCTKANQMLDAWLDDELDSDTSEQMRVHVPGCVECSTRQQNRLTLKQALNNANLRMVAPESLRISIKNLAEDQPNRVRQVSKNRKPWRDLFLILGSSLATALALTLWPILMNPQEEPKIMEAIVRHSASLASQNLLEIASNDKHAVKPWLQGRVSFAPPVPDLSAFGVSLMGARLDKVDSQTAVALVYKVRNHPINVFVWPSRGNTTKALELKKIRGFAAGTWSADGLHFVALTDIETQELRLILQRFMGLPTD